MAFSAFDDKAARPSDEAVGGALGRSKIHWDSLRQHLDERFEPAVEEWKFSGKKYGWSLQIRRRKRAIVYLTPCAKFFRASFAIGEKAAADAHDQGLPAELLDLIDGAQRYAEGRAVRLEVRNKQDVEHVKLLVAVKTAN